MPKGVRKTCEKVLAKVHPIVPVLAPKDKSSLQVSAKVTGGMFAVQFENGRVRTFKKGDVLGAARMIAKSNIGFKVFVGTKVDLVLARLIEVTAASIPVMAQAVSGNKRQREEEGSVI